MTQFRLHHRLALAVSVFFVCSAGTCHIHASSGNCHDHTNDPNHHCHQSQAAAEDSGVELGSFLQRIRVERDGRRVVLFEQIRDLRAQAGSVAQFSAAVLDANRDLLDPVGRRLFLFEVVGSSTGSEVRFTTTPPGRERPRTEPVVRMMFDATDALQAIEVR